VANRKPFAIGFPVRATELAQMVAGESEVIPPGRALAMIDPFSRRAVWLRPLRVDGRRSPAPFRDYADFMRAANGRRKGM
jgi:hypothetical protein